MPRHASHITHTELKSGRERVKKSTREVGSQEENGLGERRGDLLTGTRGDLGGVEIARGALG